MAHFRYSSEDINQRRYSLTLLVVKRYLLWIDPCPVHPDIFIRQPCLVTSLSRGNPALRAININPGYKVGFLQPQEEEEEERKELNNLGLQLIFANVLLPTALARSRPPARRFRAAVCSVKSLNYLCI
jgi:hypothetical protein